MQTNTRGSTGFHTGGGGGISPPPPRNYEIEYGCYRGGINISYLILCVIKFVPDCIRSNLRGSKFKMGGRSMPPDLPSRLTRVSMCERHPATILFPLPNSKFCTKPESNWSEVYVLCIVVTTRVADSRTQVKASTIFQFFSFIVYFYW